MKLLITGATGTLGSEVVYQALQNPKVSAIITLSRKALDIEHANASKLKNIVLDDFEDYPSSVKQQLSDVDACIWSLAITPTKSKGQDLGFVTRVCSDYTFAGLNALLSMRSKPSPLRFMYISGLVATRDLSQLPSVIPEDMKPYFTMRCNIEITLAKRAKEDSDKLQLCCARPGAIAKDNNDPHHPVFKSWIGVTDLAQVLIYQATDGFTGDPLMHKDLVKLKGDGVRGHE